MASIASLAYPKKSHRKKVLLPRHSSQFAEFMGIMMGDGGINNAWQATITVNAVADARYADHVKKLCKKLFGILPAMRMRKGKQAIVIVLSSTTVVDFLVAQGLPRGNKLAQGLSVPSWALAGSAYRRACVRGLMDTDGCLYIHKHRVAGKEYRNIGLCFSSASPTLIRQVATIFEEFGIIPHIGDKGRGVYLYSAKAVGRYVKVFGTSNDRIEGVYRKWKGG